MFLLLAQLVAPPLQQGPVRLPAPEATDEQPGRIRGGEPSLEIPTEREPVPGTEFPPSQDVTPSRPPGTFPSSPGSEFGGSGRFPSVEGLTVYSRRELSDILAGCSRSETTDRLQACAKALGARLLADGYVNSRVYIREQPPPGSLEVQEGRLVEVQVNGINPRLNRRVRHLLRPLQGQVLHVPSVQSDLRLLQRQPGITSVKGRLSRLGSDPSLASLEVTVEAGRQPWQGDVSLRNDGSNGSGEFRSVAALVKPDLVLERDTLLLFGEVNASDGAELGALITSLSYTAPLTERLSLTGAFGFSRRNLVELPSPLDTFSSSQYQGLAQLEWVFSETLRRRWSLTAGFSANRSNSYLDNRALPSTVPESVRSPRSGYLRLGLNASGLENNLAWSGTAYLLQGIGAATPSAQRRELALAGIEPGRATALGGLVSLAWGLAPAWQLNLRGGGQVAFDPLTSPMQFTLGSDVGLRGLPGQLISGDDGWLGTAELAWSFWRNDRHALQLVPFIGAGGIRTSLTDITLSDTVGAGGVLLRWLQGNTWAVELGWVEQFSTEDNFGVWTDWNLGQGLYANVRFRF